MRPAIISLAEFASVVDAVRCAVEIQHALKEKNAELPEHRQMQFRIGINLGDVIVEGERLYGDGVNIAARLESLAIPGGICISGTVYDQVENKLALNYDYQGEQTVKNIAKPVRTYRVVMDEAAATLAEQAVRRQAQHERTPTPVILSPSTSSGQALVERCSTETQGRTVAGGAGAHRGNVRHCPLFLLSYQPPALSTQHPGRASGAAAPRQTLHRRPALRQHE